MSNPYLESITKQFQFYRVLGFRAIDQLKDKQLLEVLNDESNSVAIIVKHMVGNMKSRFTDFLTSDGEKAWRNRDLEFEDGYSSKSEVVKAWNEGWNLLERTLSEISDLNRIVYIRNQEHTVFEALNRQLTHYAYHIGQIVYIGKMLKGKDWKSLSIPIWKSIEYNEEKFSKGRNNEHYSDEFMDR